MAYCKWCKKFVQVKEFCKEECRLKYNHVKNLSKLERFEKVVAELKQADPSFTGEVYTASKKLRGKYVYLWLTGNEVFYVGQGVKDRAVNKVRNPQAMLIRELAEVKGTFKTIIAKSGLTPEGALLVESVLIDLFNPVGNQAVGLKRPEQLPLTLPES